MQIGERIVALAAGDALRGAQLINEVRRYVQQGAQPLRSVAATAAAPYAALRRPASMSCRTAPTPLCAWRPTLLCDGAPPFHLNCIHSLVTSYNAVGDPDSLWPGEA
jgi:hypothetical protein